MYTQHSAPLALVDPVRDSRQADRTRALLAKLNAAIPMGHMVQPEEVVSVVAFLASDAASYITATSILPMAA